MIITVVVVVGCLIVLCICCKVGHRRNIMEFDLGFRMQLVIILLLLIV